MLIDIYCNEELGNTFSRDLGKSRGKACTLDDKKDYTLFRDYAEGETDNFRLRKHASGVWSASLLSNRDYQIRSFSWCDTHNEIEKLGYHKNFKEYCVLFTLDNCLDIVLYNCCGVPPEIVRKFPGYEYLSFCLLNCCLQMRDNICFSDFLNYHVDLDAFVESCQEDIENLNHIRKFYNGILDAASNILLSVAKTVYSTYRLSLRSQGFSNFVFGTGDVVTPRKNLPSGVNCHVKGRQFELPLHVLDRGEYLDRIKRGDIL